MHVDVLHLLQNTDLLMESGQRSANRSVLFHITRAEMILIDSLVDRHKLYQQLLG